MSLKNPKNPLVKVARWLNACGARLSKVTPQFSLFKKTMEKYVALIYLLFCCSLAWSADARQGEVSDLDKEGSERVVTTDGRTLILNADGSYEILQSGGGKKVLAKVESHYFVRAKQNYSDAIRFIPIFKNIGSETITAIKFDSKFTDTFGDTIFEIKDGSSEERIKSGKLSTNNMFYIYEDNQFIGGEPYDKLLVPVTQRTGSIETQIRVIVLENGRIIKY
jgi:hypothetical protein